MRCYRAIALIFLTKMCHFVSFCTLCATYT
nr:MAG TPA: hypothetical protein [Caudoviricetes sp.]